jgi:hypothetical protein
LILTLGSLAGPIPAVCSENLVASSATFALALSMSSFNLAAALPAPNATSFAARALIASIHSGRERFLDSRGLAHPMRFAASVIVRHCPVAISSIA